MSKLTEKQRRFADEYVRTGNASEAARLAEYSPKTAHRIGQENLQKPAIKAYIDDRLEELKKESIAEQDEVLQYLTSVMRGELKDEQLLVVGDGDFGSEVEKHERRADIVARTKAAELLGKRYRLWTEKHEVEMQGSVQFIDDIGDADES